MRPLDPRLVRWARATRAFLGATVVAGVITTAAIIVQAVLLATIIIQVFQQDATLPQVWPQTMALAAVNLVISDRLRFVGGVGWRDRLDSCVSGDWGGDRVVDRRVGCRHEVDDEQEGYVESGAEAVGE